MYIFRNLTLGCFYFRGPLLLSYGLIIYLGLVGGVGVAPTLFGGSGGSPPTIKQ